MWVLCTRLCLGCWEMFIMIWGHKYDQLWQQSKFSPSLPSCFYWPWSKNSADARHPLPSPNTSFGHVTMFLEVHVSHHSAINFVFAACVVACKGLLNDHELCENRRGIEMSENYTETSILQVCYGMRFPIQILTGFDAAANSTILQTFIGGSADSYEWELLLFAHSRQFEQPMQPRSRATVSSSVQADRALTCCLLVNAYELVFNKVHVTAVSLLQDRTVKFSLHPVKWSCLAAKSYPLKSLCCQNRVLHSESEMKNQSTPVTCA